MIATLSGVEKSYGAVRALDGIDLEIPEGSVFGLIGPNGAGKTTSMLVISTLLARDAGKVEVVGVDPQDDPKGVRRLLGYMPDFFGFYENLTTREYLEFFAAASDIKGPRRKAVVTRSAGAGGPRPQGRRRRQQPVEGHEAAPLPGPRAGARSPTPRARRACLGARSAGAGAIA